MSWSQPRAIAKIIDQQWDAIISNCNSHQIRMLQAIRTCRSPAMGGHLYRCDHCKTDHYRYNSCRNRHCDQCQHTQKQRWIERQQERLLPCAYYHLVFTIPSELNRLCLMDPNALYNMMFASAWATLNEFGWNRKYLGAQIGSTMVLHTWGSTMNFHPHLHCIVPAGGVSLRNRWLKAKGKGKFLFPVLALSKVFRGKLMQRFVKYAAQQQMQERQTLIRALYKHKWVVYAKPPFGGAKGMIGYLARYTHNIAMSHHRIQTYDKQEVKFRYTDYRHRNQKKMMTLKTREFVRRFAMHILPKGFRRIRHYGILSSVWQRKIFPDLPKRSAIDWKALWKEKGLDVLKCPRCKKGKLVLIGPLLKVRGPPRPTEHAKLNKHQHNKTENKR